MLSVIYVVIREVVTKKHHQSRLKWNVTQSWKERKILFKLLSKGECEFDGVIRDYVMV